MKRLILYVLLAVLGYSLVAIGYIMIMFANPSGYPFIIVGDIICLYSFVRFLISIKRRDKELIENKLIRQFIKLKENNTLLGKLPLSLIAIVLFSLAFGLDLIMNIYYFIF
jgi:hypothetical protein